MGCGSIAVFTDCECRKISEADGCGERRIFKDIEELSFDQIPLLDKDSAEILGNRKMGSMVDMVSQFEVDELYSQINYQDRPVRVSPLKYADLIKWFTNRKGNPGIYQD